MSTEMGMALEAGSRAAGKAFSPPFRDLNNILDTVETTLGSAGEVLLRLRISGDLIDFSFSGVDRLRWEKKKDRITMDLGFERSAWEGLSKKEIRELLANSVREGILAAIVRVQKDEEVEKELVVAALDHALAQFLDG